MIATAEPSKQAMTSFRTKLSVTMMLVVSGMTALGLYLAQRTVGTTAERDLQQNFQAQLSSLHGLEELRHAALAERCRVLSEKPRIHAALEDNALDLLYPSAKDELRDLMEGEEPSSEQAASTLHARFYRFLDGTGAVLPPPNLKDVGVINTAVEAQLALAQLPEKQQSGYLSHRDGGSDRVDEIFACIRWPVRWRSYIGCAGKSEARVDCCYWAVLWPATSSLSVSRSRWKNWRWIRNKIAPSADWQRPLSFPQVRS